MTQSNHDELRRRVRDVQAVLFTGNVDDASKMASVEVQAGFEHPLLLNLAALAAENRQELATALKLLRRALVLAPGDLGSQNALGLCLQRQDRHVEALAVFDAIIASDPELGYAHCNRGRSLLSLNRVNEATESLRRALAIKENHVALASMSRISSLRGNHAEARAYAKQALAMVPNYPDAVVSQVEADLAEDELARAEGAIRALLADERVDTLDRALATNLLGDVLDASGRYDEAMAAYTRGNDLRLGIFAAQYDAERGAAHHTLRLLKYFEAAEPANWTRITTPRTHSSAESHVFLLGFPRSGTTLLEHVLDGHPRITSLEEHETLIDGVRRFLMDSAGMDDLAIADEATLDQYRDSYWREVSRAGVDPSGTVFVDKYPLNTLKLPLIAKLFPDALILHAVRDPRDVVLSCFRRRFAMNAPMFEFLTLKSAANFYDLTMHLTHAFQRVADLDIKFVRYEQLVQDFDTQLEDICSWMGIDFQPQLADFGSRAHGRRVLTPSTAQLADGLNSRSVGHWRHYAPYLTEVWPALQYWITQFEYPL